VTARRLQEHDNRRLALSYRSLRDSLSSKPLPSCIQVSYTSGQFLE
jgi:hypothetical protein